MESIVLWLVYTCICIFFLVMWVKYYLHKRRIKNLKYKGLGLLKKASVFNIGERYVSGDSDSAGYDLYRLEAKDEDENIYESENFKDADNGGRTLEEMVVKYDGVVYDLGNKDVAIRQINNNIQRLEGELSNNPGFFKKIEIKKDIEVMKRYIDEANEGPITPYLVCNGHKVSIGDTVDVFVNPENPNEYYFDLDFTKQK